MSNNAKELYWLGHRKVVLNDLTLLGTPFDNPTALEFMNFAFELFYNCRQGVMKCGDAKMQKEMTSELEDAATEGTGRGVDDLQEAIYHAVDWKADHGIDEPYQWYSSKAETYECIPYDPQRFLNPYDNRVATLWQGGDVTAAKACVLFVRAMDEKFIELGKASKPYGKAVDALQKLADNKNSPDQDWKTMGEHLENAGTVASEVKRWMWLAPDTLQGFERYIGGAADFLGVANKIKDIGNNYVHYGNSLSMALLEEALGYLPVLGGFYAKALHMIPGLERWFKAVVQHRIDKIDAIFRDEHANLRIRQTGTQSSAFAVRSAPVQGTFRTVGPWQTS